MKELLESEGESVPSSPMTLPQASVREAAPRRLPTDERFRMLVEQSLAGIFVLRGNKFVYVNPRFCEIFGYTEEEVLQLEVDELVGESDRPLVREKLRQRDAGEVAEVHYQFLGRRKDGTLVELETLGSATTVDGEPGTMGTLLDVSQSRRALEAVRESEERYALASQGASDGLWDWDLRIGAIYFSPRWAAQVGSEVADLGDDPNAWIGRIHADDRKRVLADISLHLEGKTPHLEVEYRLRHDDGTFRWMLGRGLAVRDEKGRAYRMAGSQTDITERRRAAEKLAHDSLHDGLTGLPNRALFMDRVGQAMAFQRRRAD